MPRHLSAADYGTSRPLNPKMLWVVVVVSNPVLWVSRVRLAREFLARMREAGVSVCLVEHAFGERHFELDGEQVDLYVPVRGGDDSELWLKESLINCGVRHIPQVQKDWRYIAWIDADLQFANPNWAVDTLNALQHWPVVQPWSRCLDLGPTYEIVHDERGLKENRSFAAAWHAGDFDAYDAGHPNGGKHGWSPYFQAHVGYAWAMRREAYEGIGGLISWIPTGAGDWQMAMAFAGRLAPHPQRTDGFNKRLMVFQDRCDRHIQQSIGLVPGTILHYYHGSKKRRGYVNRDNWLETTRFDPDVDLVYDAQGVPVLSGENRKLRDFLRRYFRSRNEDGYDAEDLPGDAFSFGSPLGG